MDVKKNKIRPLGIFLIIALAVLIALTLVSLIIIKSNKIIFSRQSLGSPYEEIYSEEQPGSRLADDLVFFEGRLYVGGGDYDANTGPIAVMSYSLDEGSWASSVTPLPDEQIKRFRIIDGSLIIPGTDPTDSWELGNYYILGDLGWETLRTLPDGVHCFDAIGYKGDIFFGLGVVSGKYPAVRFDGESYLPVEFYKDGTALDTSAHETVRVYNLFEFKNSLFAFLTLDKTEENGKKIYYMDLYAYNGEVFEFVNGSLPSEDMPDVITTEDSVFFVMNGGLFESGDLNSFDRVILDEKVTVADICAQGDSLFVLTNKKSLFGYEIAVYERTEKGYVKLFGMLGKAPAGAFCRGEDCFFISLGSREEPSPNAGKIFMIKDR